VTVGEIVVLVAAIMLGIGLAVGLLTFTPARAAAVRAAESGDPDQIELVTDRLAVSHRKFVPTKRGALDRHPDYIATHIGVASVSVGLVFGRIPRATALFGLSPLLQHALATAMGVSALCGLLGILLSLRDNRLSYALGLCASLGIMLAMGSYEVMIMAHSDLVGTLGGGLALTITGARMWMVPRFWREIRSLSRLRDRIAEQL